MSYLLNCLYLATLVAATPWMVWRSIRTGRYREGWLQKLFGFVPRREGDEACIWLHGVSVGEIQLLRPLVAEIKERWPQATIAISYTTQTAKQLSDRLFPDTLRFYCPMDFTWSVRRVMRRLRPKLLVLAELELWPNLVQCAKSAGASVTVVNGRLSERSFRGYGHIGWLFRRTLSQIDWVGAQDASYASRFIKLGAVPDRVSVTGSMKFDGAEFDREHPEVQSRRLLLGLSEREHVWVVGSTQSPEESYAIEAYHQALTQFPNLKLILVPRHPERFDEVQEQLAATQLRWIRRSRIGNFVEPQNWQVLLADTVGELRWWWGLADLGFVGGSFGNRGGQNMLEPAAFGVCTSFGPNTKNFRDIVRLLDDAQSVTILENPEQLGPWVIEMLSHPKTAITLGNRARQVVRTHRGATERTVDGLACFLAPVAKMKRHAA